MNITISEFNKIKDQFIEVLKDYSNFDRLSKNEKITVAKNSLEKVFDITNSYPEKNIKEEILNELLSTVVFGLKKIQDIYDDHDIEEIMINGIDGVFIKKRNLNSKNEKIDINNSRQKTDIQFNSETEIYEVIEKLLEGTHRRVDKSNPLVDIRLPDGNRANIALPPVAINGPVVTIRKFTEKPITLADLVKSETISSKLHDFLIKATNMRANILIAGGTGSGKTTTLNAVASCIPENDRVIIIEETSEINIKNFVKNTVNLETRFSNSDSNNEISIRMLLKNALRMKPDRIIVGEVRGDEAFDMIQAMNTGHPGSFTTLHANSTTDVIERLKAMLMLSGFNQMSLETINNWIINSVDIIIWQNQGADGVRRIIDVSTIDASGKITKLFEYKNKSYKISEANITKLFNKLKTK